MRKLLGGMAVGSLCLILSFGGIGCQSKDKGKFVDGPDSFTLDKKDGTAEAKFKKDVDSVTPGDQKGVTATKGTKTVTFKQTGDSPESDETMTFTVKGKDKADEAKITVKVVGKKKTPNGKTVEMLMASTTTVNLSDDKKSETVTFTKGEPKSVLPESKDGVTAKVEGKTVVFSITAASEKASSNTFTVAGTKDEKPATITVNVAAKKVEAPKTVPITVDMAKVDLKAEKGKTNEAKVKVTAGKAVSAKLEKDTPGVTITPWPLGDGVTISVAETAMAGTVDAWVWGEGADNKTKITINVMK